MAAGYAHPEVLVETSWVTDHMKDPGLRIVEVSVDPTTFEQGHIAGAMAFNWFTDLEEPLRRDIVSKAREGVGEERIYDPEHAPLLRLSIERGDLHLSRKTWWHTGVSLNP